MRYSFNPEKRPVIEKIEKITYVVSESELCEQDFSEEFETKDEALEYIKVNGSPTLCYREKKFYVPKRKRFNTSIKKR
jgi:hypothetical protein